MTSPLYPHKYVTQVVCLLTDLGQIAKILHSRKLVLWKRLIHLRHASKESPRRYLLGPRYSVNFYKLRGERQGLETIRLAGCA